MNIVIDIGHPAHVHYFKNFIEIMQDNGHNFLITARDRGETFHLLKAYKILFINRGKGATTKLGKLLFLPKLVFFIYRRARKFKPDLFLSFGSPYAAHVSKLMKKPHIAFDDTEHSKVEQALYLPFTDVVYTPECFQKSLGRKHRRFKGYIELSYLHPDYYSPDPSVFDLLGLKNGEKYAVLRFISWSAGHDSGHTGMSQDIKKKAVRELSKYAKVYISSEGDLPDMFKEYHLPTSPEKIHDVMYYASLFLGESGTMATEAALLGTPSVRISTIAKLVGNHVELKNKYGLLYYYDSGEEGLNKALELIKKETKQEWHKKQKAMLSDKIDVTRFMIDSVLQYKI